jgi:phenylalanyl-tRNA synthetase alpha subunit
MKDLSPEERKTKGAEYKALFDEVEKAFYAKQSEIQKAHWDVQLNKEIIDYSTPAPQTDV